jgi:nucleotide-binding universal stress UspA family protein
MYKNLLIPTDGSELARKAIQHGVALAKAIGAKVTGLTVTAPFRVVTLAMGVVEDATTDYQKRMQENATKILGAITETAKAAGVACETVLAEHDYPYRAIIDTARSQGCDLIVMASHGRGGIAALVLGSETVKVLTHSNIPVLVHR